MAATPSGQEPTPVAAGPAPAVPAPGSEPPAPPAPAGEPPADAGPGQAGAGHHGPGQAGVGHPGELRALRVAAEVAATAADLDEAASVVLRELCHMLDCPAGHLYLAVDGVLSPTTTWHLSDPDRFRVMRQVAQAMELPAGPEGGVPGRALASGTAECGAEVREAAAQAGLSFALALPVHSQDQVVAVLHLLGEAVPANGAVEAAAAVAAQLGRVVDRRRASALAADRLRLVAGANDAYVRLDSEGLIADWNSRAESMFGWARHDVLGRRLAEVIVPTRYRAAYEDALGQALSGAPALAPTRRELSALHRSGQELPVEVTAWGSHDGDGVVVDSFIRDVSERHRLEVQLAREALHDRLTGLPNRVLLRDRLEHALARAERNRSGLALLVLDVDRFKVVNDSLGHERGDRLLVAVGERLARLLAPGDTLARLGGDEFAIVCEGVSSREEAASLAAKVLGAFDVHFLLGAPQGEATDIALTASLGVAQADGAESDADLLLRDADVAMYRAKQRGRARFEVFVEAMRTEAVDRLSVENDLRRAIRQGQLRLLYQPIVHLDSGRVAGLEALVRWQHPARGTLAPADFIPPAEDTGLIIPLGRIVLREACLQAAAWQRLRPRDRPLRMSVNVSPKQLQRPGWAEEVASTLAEAGLDPALLVLEITESVLVDDGAPAVAPLEQLRRLGVRIAIDDFGTGYSSLGYLRRLPVDVLKIDRTFIEGVAGGPHESALARAVIKLARTLGLDAVAEGVADARQLAELRRLRCPYGQGFHLCRPLPTDQAAEVVGGASLPAAGERAPAEAAEGLP